mmetsp:Transcript_70570/g.228571  ORF Transcript_70570/g.228571 Transcript_70570/m.228571 type:complete len:292 (+) Transcript_70570:272-1147(+)
MPSRSRTSRLGRFSKSSSRKIARPAQRPPLLPGGGSRGAAAATRPCRKSATLTISSWSKSKARNHWEHSRKRRPRFRSHIEKVSRVQRTSRSSSSASPAASAVAAGGPKPPLVCCLGWSPSSASNMCKACAHSLSPRPASTHSRQRCQRRGCSAARGACRKCVGAGGRLEQASLGLLSTNSRDNACGSAGNAWQNLSSTSPLRAGARVSSPIAAEDCRGEAGKDTPGAASPRAASPPVRRAAPPRAPAGVDFGEGAVVAGGRLGPRCSFGLPLLPPFRPAVAVLGSRTDPE